MGKHVQKQHPEYIFLLQKKIVQIIYGANIKDHINVIFPNLPILILGTTIMVWACDAKGRDPHNKKHVEHDGDGDPTQRTSKDEMA